MLAARNHALLGLRTRAWFGPLEHDAQDQDTRLVVVADSDDGFGPAFDRELLATLDEGEWRDADGEVVGPVVAVRSLCSETIQAGPSAEALAFAASMSGLRTVVACLGGALMGFSS